jgi:hypothetical protein
MPQVVAYGKTPLGQLLFDLAYTDLSERYLARKHDKPVAEIRRLRALPDVQYLRDQSIRDKQRKRR